MKQEFQINGRAVSAQRPPYIIAEMSANHNGSIERAFETIRQAKLCGVDAVKMQTYTPDTMTIDSANDDFLIKEGLWKGRTLYELYSEAYTPFEWHEPLFNFAAEQGVTLFSSPFDETAVELLASLDAPAYKVASFELIDLPLIECIARQKKPTFMSTGMATVEEIGTAIETARRNGCDQLVIFHCISGYPTPLEEANLSAIKLLKAEFDVEVGLSDHTFGNLASIVATALGASAIEKHFTLSRDDGGVDSAFSIEPDEMTQLVSDTKLAHAGLGGGQLTRTKAEEASRNYRRSLYFVKDLQAGHQITKDDIQIIRPGFGLSPSHYSEVIGTTLSAPVRHGDRVTMDVLQKNQ